MSKKKLLSEAQVRRFMGLAGINPVNEEYSYMMEEEEAELPAEEEDMAPVPEEEPVEEPEMEEEPAAEADVSIDEEDLNVVKQALDDLNNKLAPLLGAVEEEPAEEMPELPEEEPMEEPVEEPAEEEEEELEEALAGVSMELSEEEIVNEVTRRVAKRILEAKRARDKMNEALGRRTSKPRRKK